MTIPRLLIPKQTYLVTRRCAQRSFFLKPGPRVNQVFQYCLAHASKKFDIEVHAYIVMSNHYHLVISETNEDVKLPKFMHWLNLHVAKALNLVLKREENFWSSKPYSAVLLADADAILDKLIYTLLNPVKSNLVRRFGRWRGAKSAIHQFGGRTLTFHKPSVFFRGSSHLPDQEQLNLTVPKPFSRLSPKQFQTLLKEKLGEQIRQSTNTESSSQPESLVVSSAQEQPRSKEPRFRFNPRFACKDFQLRQTITELWKDFLSSYADAWSLWKRGVRNTPFPRGTYLMRIKHRVICGDEQESTQKTLKSVLML